MGQPGSKRGEMGSTHTHVHPKWHGTIFGKTHVGPFFVQLLAPNWLIFRPFWTLDGPIGVKTGPK